MPPRSTIKITTPLLLMLALLASITPFGIDLYLSAFPRMAGDLHTSATMVQLTLTMFLLGLAGGQLGFGPVSDRVGRRGPLLVGSAVFIVAGVVAALAPTITVLLVARLAQGVGAAAGMVLGRAIIADAETGRAAARAFGTMMLVSNLAPVIAPFVGSLLIDQLGWRGVLLVLAGLAVAMLLGSASIVRESLPPERRDASARSGLRALADRSYLSPAAVFVLSFGVLMAYISASPFLYQTLIGVGAVAYGLLFALNALGLVAGSAISTRCLRTGEPRRILATWLAVLLLASLTLLVMTLLPIPPAWLPVPIFVAVSAVGALLGPATGAALDAVPHAIGTGSAVLGCAQFGLAAAVSPLVSLGGEHSPVGMGTTIAVLAVLAVASFTPSLVRPRPAAQVPGTADDAPVAPADTTTA
jgi:MFS transporter, DHA1 family, multidrug resistance protein